MSRSLVGSSRRSTLGASIRRPARYRRRCSPPESRPMDRECICGGNKKRSNICEALMMPSAVTTLLAMLQM